jgi:hypothetical protein
MSAYWIAIYQEISDESRLAAYQEALVALDGGAVRDLRIVPGAS